jgi:hypothetical protein
MRILYSLLLATTLYAACNPPSPPANQSLSDSARAVATVTHLLKWYKTKFDSIQGFILVNIPSSEDSGYNNVNFEETGRLLNALRSSGYFTEKFLTDKQDYFRHCDSFFAAKKENNRSPTGFDRDIVLSSSHTEEFLEDTIAPNIRVINPQTVIFGKYLVFTLKKKGDTCQVDNIRFITDPDSASDPVYTRGADSTDPVIREIRKEYEQIEAGKDKFRIVDKDIMDQSTEGGDDTLYYDGNQLRKAKVEYFGETGKVCYQYYFAHGQMLFCRSRETRYTKPFYIDNYDIGIIKTVRCYFQNGHLIRCIDEKGELVDKGLYPARERELLEADSAFFTTFRP